MLDLKELREDPHGIECRLRTKDPEISLAPLLKLDDRARHLIQSVEALKAKRNDLSKKVGELKREGKDATEVLQAVSSFGDEITALDHELNLISQELSKGLLSLPNIPMEGIKSSLNPADNICIKTYGEKREFDFTPKNHVELNQTLGYFDFERGAKVAGTGWPVYKGDGARLEWALLNYMIDIHRKNGFTQIIPPHLVRPEIMQGSGQLPKFETQLFKLKDDDYHLYLIPTSEVALCGLHYDEIIDDAALPIKYVSYTPCFRREGGAAGSKERGLIRVHQFNKVEMFAFTRPEESEEMFELMLKSAEEILQGLGLHYRNMLLVTGDMSFAAAKTVDIEAYLPGQNRYYEVSSVSNCTDFQSRRSQIRCKAPGGKTRLVHTLNGSGLATSRLMVALLENNQNKDGTVSLPSVLNRYLSIP
ncbi:MAG: serine--tRNA ligase [Simkaniaceae bacterium]|nr:serine--tRNA ligase [Simkaniaceae bacterium]